MHFGFKKILLIFLSFRDYNKFFDEFLIWHEMYLVTDYFDKFQNEKKLIINNKNFQNEYKILK